MVRIQLPQLPVLWKEWNSEQTENTYSEMKQLFQIEHLGLSLQWQPNAMKPF